MRGHLPDTLPSSGACRATFPPRGRHSRPIQQTKSKLSLFFHFPLNFRKMRPYTKRVRQRRTKRPAFCEKNFFPPLNFCQMRPYTYSVRRWQTSPTNSFVVKRQPYKRRVYHDLCTLRKRNPGQRGILPLLRHGSKNPRRRDPRPRRKFPQAGTQPAQDAGARRVSGGAAGGRAGVLPAQTHHQPQPLCHPFGGRVRHRGQAQRRV